jgi:chemotaxis protein MotD
LTVDRPETLDLLRREAPQLERALQDAGLKTGDSALQFSLRDQGTGGQQNARSDRLMNAATIIVPDADAPTHEVARNYRRSVGTSGIDIRV